jgi:enoyl-CoA hydratase/carnithine racemase
MRYGRAMTDAGILRVERVGPVGRVVLLTMDRSAVRNAIDDALLDALIAAFRGLASAAEDGARAAVITGAGGAAFSAGMDLLERSGFSDAQLDDQHRRIVEMIDLVHTAPLPVVAAVEGFALAGGFELALACDLVVASSAAVFGLPEVRVGIFPGGGSTRLLAWAVGAARARDLILTGRRITAAEAESWGIVARLVPAGEALAGAMAVAGELAAGAPLGISEARRAIRAAHVSLASGVEAENEMYDVVARSGDRREGFRAFVEKRPARFEGR